jgi:transcriptional regulator with XRE-family HTH domain
MKPNPVSVKERRAYLARREGRYSFERVLGGRIAQLRERRGWGRMELADRLGIPLERLKKWEQGANLPTLDMIEPLARILGVSIDELMTGKPSTPTELGPKQRDEAKSLIAGLVRLLNLSRDRNGAAEPRQMRP